MASFLYSDLEWLDSVIKFTVLYTKSPAVADKPAWRESMPKIASIRRAYNVVADNTGLSSFIPLAVAESEICEISEKFSENSNLSSSRSSNYGPTYVFNYSTFYVSVSIILITSFFTRATLC